MSRKCIDIKNSSILYRGVARGVALLAGLLAGIVAGLLARRVARRVAGLFGVYYSSSLNTVFSSIMMICSVGGTGSATAATAATTFS